MNILFLSLGKYTSLKDCGLYSDLLKNLVADGHSLFVVSPLERREHKKTFVCNDGGCAFLNVKTLNIQKTNLFEKGLGTITLPRRFLRGINKYFKNVTFDLIIYPTPPITIYGVVKKIKKKHNAKTYLMLKDIFPQNAVDLEILKTSGVKGIIYNFFRKTEKKLYYISDKIGCMSKANCDYLLEHNPYLPADRVEIFPNCINPATKKLSKKEIQIIRKIYDIPLSKKIFVYGGNLGKPQNLNFVIECIDKCKDIDEAYFLIIGNGTEKNTIINYINK